MSTDKKMLLIEASIELFYKQGFWKSSTASIAKHANVATGTLFNYFDSKEQLIDAVYLHIKAELLAQLSKCYEASDSQLQVKEALQQQWDCYVSWGIENPIKHSLLQQLKLSDLVSDQAQQTGMQSFSGFLRIIQGWLNSKMLKAMEIEYFTEIFHAQLEASLNIAKRHSLQGAQLKVHLQLSFEVFWGGVKNIPDES